MSRREVVKSCLAVLLLAGATTPANAADSRQWHLGFLGVTQAQTITKGAGVVVAVIDTGVDAGHPDLAGSVLHGADIANDPHSGDGRVDVVGHGTGMAGLIAAHGRAVGVAPASKILPVRAFTDVSALGAPSQKVAAAIDWAVDHGATVMNISAGGQLGSDSERLAIARAVARNVVVVAAAGNKPEAVELEYPAAYNDVVAVVGVDRQGHHADVSVSGAGAVIAAPAVDIFSTDVRGVGLSGYSTGTGTSAAAAIVSGVVALIRSRFPKLPAAEVVRRLTATADDRGPPGRDADYGYGIVNPVKALTADLPVPPSASAVTSALPGPSADDGESGAPLGWLAVAGAVAIVAPVVVLTVRRRQRKLR